MSMKNFELAKLGGVHFNTVTKVRKVIGIEKMDKKKGKEFVKGLEEQPIVSPFEFTELMGK